ncbi:hypothetical protein C8T65DRAFT_668957 [Cerioporus squamosus]|nr:hypothetical protein C8T65DRAFT_668957 [Cerioporus squamosus]
MAAANRQSALQAEHRVPPNLAQHSQAPKKPRSRQRAANANPEVSGAAPQASELGVGLEDANQDSGVTPEVPASSPPDPCSCHINLNVQQERTVVVSHQ